MAKTKAVVRQRNFRIPVYLNEAEYAALADLIDNHNKVSKDEPLAGRAMDRSSMIRFLIIKAAKRLPKNGAR
jgi:hypothetical protein